MSLQTDAETINDLLSKIIRFEGLRTQFQQGGGSVRLVEGMDESSVSLSAAQKQALLAQEDAWKAAIKTIVAAW